MEFLIMVDLFSTFIFELNICCQDKFQKSSQQTNENFYRSTRTCKFIFNTSVCERTEMYKGDKETQVDDYYIEIILSI